MEIYNLHLTKRLCHNGSHAVIEERGMKKKIANRRDKIGEQHQQQQQRLQSEIKYIFRLAGDSTWQSSGSSSISFVFLFNSWILNQVTVAVSIWLLFQNVSTPLFCLRPTCSLSTSPKGIEIAQMKNTIASERRVRKKGINRTVASQKGNESKYYRH